MTRALTVWGINVLREGNQYRAIVATTTKKAAAEAFGVGTYEFRNYAEETGNRDEVALATSTPGQVWVHLADVSASFHTGSWAKGEI